MILVCIFKPRSSYLNDPKVWDRQDCANSIDQDQTAPRLLLESFEPHHEKTVFLHMRKQRRRSAVR